MARTRAIAVIVAGLAALTALALWSASRWASGEAKRAAGFEAAQGAKGAASLLNSELQKFRLIPAVLAESPTVDEALRNPSAASKLDETLELLGGRTNAAAIFVIRSDGLTIAASNWRQLTSFVGQNYRFRQYFRDAMREGSGQFFALGTVSHRPGLYLARRVERAGRILGVVVLKVEFSWLERFWNNGRNMTVVSNTTGVILISSRNEFRFRTLRPLATDQRVNIARSGQFPGIDLLPIPAGRPAADLLIFSDPQSVGGLFVQASEPLPLGWTLYRWQHLAPALAAAWTRALVALLSICIVLIIVVGLVVRSRERLRMNAHARAELIDQVHLRTVELRQSNERLRLTSAEREAFSKRFRAAREELAQANRLGSLGQITAGIAHEVNQPTAAIRSYAENGMALLDRGDIATARGNLVNIVELADRIGRITSELRNFARRRVPEPRLVSLGDAIDGLHLLINDALRSARVELRYDREAVPGIRIFGDKIRLEQILINLVQNAIDAIGPDGGWISLSCRCDPRWIELLVADSGPGVPQGIRETLFSPFVTSKANGLGLGLGIARDIARSFGGDLLHVPEAGEHHFALRLPRT